ncbi:MAG: septum formation initiator family protein [Deltaproteobacteria bacterium]|nr:septum formation initiator family protein [Deltaproteobacteria bacterium]
MKFSDNHPGAGHQIAMILAVMGIVVLFFSIIVGDKGISSLQLIKNERQVLISSHAELKRKNLQLYHEIERLKKDPVYIEAIARQELGLIGKKEIVINMSNITAAAEKK